MASAVCKVARCNFEQVLFDEVPIVAKGSSFTPACFQKYVCLYVVMTPAQKQHAYAPARLTADAYDLQQGLVTKIL